MSGRHDSLGEFVDGLDSRRHLTVADVHRALEAIGEMSVRDPGAHEAEDALYVRVLRTIADGRAEDPRALAKAALAAADLEFERWYE